MFTLYDVREFIFVIVPDYEEDDLRFCIDYWEKDHRTTIFLDSVRTWINDVMGKKNTKTVDEMVQAVLDHFWIPCIEKGVKEDWKNRGYTVDEISYRNAVDLFFATLRTFALGAVRDKNLAYKPFVEPVKKERSLAEETQEPDMSEMQGWDKL